MLVQRTISTVAVACVALSLAVPSAHAQNQSGTWDQDASGLWSNPSDWLSGIANGATFTADFSTINITGDRTVTLDSSRSIGQLIFQDKTTASNNWILTNSGGAILTLDNGASQPVINVLNQTTTISAVLGGTNGVDLTGGNATLVLSGVNTYSGVTTLNSTSGTGNQFTIQLGNNSALGTSTLNINPGASNNARVELNSNVNLPNNITITSQRTLSGGNGTLMTNGDVNATFSGTITINGPDVSGGHFVGAQETTFNPAGNYLTFSGPIISTLSSTGKDKAGGAGNALVARAGNLRFADTTGTSSYFRIEDRAGALQVGATNGIATNAYVDVGGNSNGNPQNYSVLDLNGFNQTLVGVSNYVTNTFAATVTNSSTTTAATLTIAPANPTSDTNQANLVFTAGAAGTGTNANITDASASFPLSITINGDPTGTQYFTTPNNSYRGVTTLTSGTLAISSLANGGSNSSIGASSNVAGNLVFNGGTLQYVNSSLNSTNGVVALSNSTTPSTDRNFTILAGSSGTINVASVGTTLTMSGGSAATTGTLNKAGPGTLILTGLSSHTGGTNVNAGTLLVNSPGSLAGAVNVALGATLGGTGTIGGTVTPASGGVIAPGPVGGLGTLTVGNLTLNGGAFLTYEIAGTSSLDQITVSNSGGMTLNGGSFNLFDTLGNPFTANGVYTLINYSGGFSGALGNLSVNSADATKAYALSSTSTAVQVTVSDAITDNWTNNTADNQRQLDRRDTECRRRRRKIRHRSGWQQWHGAAQR
jgi:fibronectin-binding autotransporter adhesin